MRNFFQQKDLSKARILVVGYGVEGRGTVDFLSARKAGILIYDEQPRDKFAKEEVEALEAKGIELYLDEDPKLLASLQEKPVDYAIRSPGIPLDSAIIKKLQDAGVTITSATNIFMSLCPSPTIGVTGTKGKGTTSALIHEILLASGRDSYLGGNIGIPLLLILDKLTPQSIAVLELSSFQLEDLEISPHIVVLLMIVEDHLDYHHNLENYHNAKASIVKYQTEKDYLVFNPDYQATFKIAATSSAQKFGVSIKKSLQTGCFFHGKHIVYSQDGQEEKIAEVKDVALPGLHNLENVCAAIAASKLVGATSEGIEQALKTFRGLEHRLEFVREFHDVRYYNDSIATNPASAIAAINAFPGSQILILGGSGKGADFTELADEIAKHPHIHTIIGVGDEWSRIKVAIERALARVGRNGEIRYLENAQHMQWIVEAAAKNAFPGDVVLLAPAAASFDMFKSYKDRGSQFKYWVTKL